MRRVEPKVFLVGVTTVTTGMTAYLDFVKTKWRPGANQSERPHGTPVSCMEALIEFMGRLCYRSWEPGMNANISKIREGNDVYLKNILDSGHGSVLEHAVSNWVFADVSRVFTHELVRHRAGTAFSQESLRFVRLTDLGLWLPPEIENDPELVQLFEKVFKDAGDLQKSVAEHLHLDEPGVKFAEKKKLTSAMRRLAPDGLATTIGVSFNMRALRHVIEMRTAEFSEAEIRLVFDKVATIAKELWPNIFQDFTRQEDGAWVPTNRKV